MGYVAFQPSKPVSELGKDIHHHLSWELREVDFKLQEEGIDDNSRSEINSPFCLGYILGLTCGELMRRKVMASPIEIKFLLQKACDAVYKDKMAAFDRIQENLENRQSFWGRLFNKKELAVFNMGDAYAGNRSLNYGMSKCHGLTDFIIAHKFNQLDGFFNNVGFENGMGEVVGSIFKS